MFKFADGRKASRPSEINSDLWDVLSRKQRSLYLQKKQEKLSGEASSVPRDAGPPPPPAANASSVSNDAGRTADVPVPLGAQVLMTTPGLRGKSTPTLMPPSQLRSVRQDAAALAKKHPGHRCRAT